MTSAFILPDITIRNLATENQPAEPNQDINNGLVEHEDQNCTVCRRIIRPGIDHQHNLSRDQKFVIPKPVPVSQRMPEPSEYVDEPTIRPSQPPGEALATVLKGLEDELTHTKIQLNHAQSLYNAHDPALSKRERKSVGERIQRLLKVMDVKADQIYALYDVLEGQKDAGEEISKEEIEITLQSIGIEPSKLGLRGGAAAEKKNAREQHPWEMESEGGEDDEPPWEGLEDTREDL